MTVSRTVMELGAGTGLNLKHYPSAVDRLVLKPDGRFCSWSTCGPTA